MSGNIIICKNCKQQFEGNYCNHCGQSGEISKINFSSLLHEFIYGFFHFKGGLIYTIKELLIEPGQMLRGYIAGKRVGKFNPFTYLILVSILGRFLYNHSDIIEHSDQVFLASKESLKFTAGHLNYRLLLFVPIYSIINLLVQRSYRYNLAEELIINTYIISQSALISSIWLIALDIIKPHSEGFLILFYCGYMAIICYQVYAFVQFYNKGSLWTRLLKSCLTSIGGFTLSFFVLNGAFYTLKLIQSWIQ